MGRWHGPIPLECTLLVRAGGMDAASPGPEFDPSPCTAAPRPAAHVPGHGVWRCRCRRCCASIRSSSFIRSFTSTHDGAGSRAAERLAAGPLRIAAVAHPAVLRGFAGPPRGRCAARTATPGRGLGVRRRRPGPGRRGRVRPPRRGGRGARAAFDAAPLAGTYAGTHSGTRSRAGSGGFDGCIGRRSTRNPSCIAGRHQPAAAGAGPPAAPGQPAAASALGHRLPRRRGARTPRPQCRPCRSSSRHRAAARPLRSRWSRPQLQQCSTL